MSHFKQPQIFKNTRFCAKLKVLKLGSKIFLSGCFGQQSEKTIVIFEISTLKYKCKVKHKTKTLELWDQKYFISVFLGKILRKTINIIEISTLEFVKKKNNSCKAKQI